LTLVCGTALEIEGDMDGFCNFIEKLKYLEKIEVQITNNASVVCE
jgi:hypothetical protein